MLFLACPPLSAASQLAPLTTALSSSSVDGAPASIDHCPCQTLLSLPFPDLSSAPHILQQAVNLAAAAPQGPTGAAYFAATYVAASLVLIPSSLLAVAAGYLFGPLYGAAVVSFASTAAAAAAFLISRYAARPFVSRQLARLDRLQAVERGLSQGGRKLVFLWRLSPLFPFSMSSYMFGLTSVRLPDFLLGTWAGKLPGTMAYAYLGDVGRAAVDAVADGLESSQELEPVRLLLYAAGGLATLGIVKDVSEQAARAVETAGQGDDGK